MMALGSRAAPFAVLAKAKADIGRSIPVIVVGVAHSFPSWLVWDRNLVYCLHINCYSAQTVQKLALTRTCDL